MSLRIFPEIIPWTSEGSCANNGELTRRASPDVQSMALRYSAMRIDSFGGCGGEGALRDGESKSARYCKPALWKKLFSLGYSRLDCQDFGFGSTSVLKVCGYIIKSFNYLPLPALRKPSTPPEYSGRLSQPFEPRSISLWYVNLLSDPHAWVSQGTFPGCLIGQVCTLTASH